MWKPKKPEQLIKDHKNRVPLKELCERYNGTSDQIRGFLKHVNAWTPYKKHKTSLPEKEIVSLYKDDWSVAEIAEKFSVSTSPIVSILKKYNVRKPNWAKSLPYKTYELLSNRDYFTEQYERLVSQKALAEHFNVGHDMISSVMKLHGIQPKQSALVRSLRNQKSSDYSLDRQTFEYLHFGEDKSIVEIAKLMHVSPNYLRTHIRQWGIEIQDVRVSKKFRQFEQMSREQVKALLDEFTVSELTEKFQACREKIIEVINKHDLDLPFRSSSSQEKEIGNYIESLGFEIRRNDRSIIPPLELDIFIPNANVAIEYCGLYWHSEVNKPDKNYHVHKLELCEQRGIRLVTIFEDEYKTNSELILSKISSILKKAEGERINARDCRVEVIEDQMTKSVFLNSNHIQGNDRSQISLGLRDRHDRLVAIMTFSRPSRVRASKSMILQSGLWELNRFATQRGMIVRGGASKLLSYFKENFQWDAIYSYADRRWSTGDLYFKLGFDLVSKTPPNYWYVSPRFDKRLYRYNFAKFKLVEQGFDRNLTEKQIMESRGYSRIWDCGHLKFQMIK